MNIKLIVAIAASVSLSACSTIVNGSNQMVNFNTGDVNGADCVATGGSDYALNEKFTTPAEVKLPRSKKKIDITCNKAGYQAGTKSILGKVEGSAAGNIIAGGGIGLGIDALTGAIYKYPDTVSIPMERIGAMSPTVTGEPIS
jgi:hypothetical protein